MRNQVAKARLRKRLIVSLAVGIPVLLIVALTAHLHAHPPAVLAPHGEIGYAERRLMIIAGVLSVLVLVPVYTMTIIIATKYREGNQKYTKYTPDWDGNRLYELIWWGIPCAIIAFLGVVTWRSTYALDPYKSLTSVNKPLSVQVISLDWKWLFIYPDQHVASVNELAMPVDTPVEFTITSDTVMNSFWIPNLGSQIYAMPGMDTKLHLEADKAGNYPGSSANISGAGFAGMKFTAKAMSDKDFSAWLKQAGSSQNALTAAAYDKLAQPSSNTPVSYYKQPARGLYDDVIMNYMMPHVHAEGAH